MFLLLVFREILVISVLMTSHCLWRVKCADDITLFVTCEVCWWHHTVCDVWSVLMISHCLWRVKCADDITLFVTCEVCWWHHTVCDEWSVLMTSQCLWRVKCADDITLFVTCEVCWWHHTVCDVCWWHHTVCDVWSVLMTSHFVTCEVCWWHHTACPLRSPSEQRDRFSRNFIWPLSLCATPYRRFLFSRNRTGNTAKVRTCEVGSTIVPVALSYWNDLRYCVQIFLR
jgi:hypothetical protein